MASKAKISVIIMTLNAQAYLQKLLWMLTRQTVMPDEIIVADSESTDGTLQIASAFKNVQILPIERASFDHGGSRDRALRASTGDIVFFFTQDAEIGDDRYLETLLNGFQDEKVAMAYARQMAKPNAAPYEKYIREFNYPETRRVRTIEDVRTLGIKAFYMSDACSAYRRTAYLDIGGFEAPALTNEDMLIAARALMKGYHTLYEPGAFVYHSHNFSLKQEFKRNFDVAAFMAMHAKEFSGIRLDGEGARLVKYVSVRLLKRGRLLSFIRFALICCAKYLGNAAGRNFERMSIKKRCQYSNSPTFWVRYGARTANPSKGNRE